MVSNSCRYGERVESPTPGAAYIQEPKPGPPLPFLANFRRSGNSAAHTHTKSLRPVVQRPYFMYGCYYHFNNLRLINSTNNMVSAAWSASHLKHEFVLCVSSEILKRRLLKRSLATTIHFAAHANTSCHET